MNIANLVHTAYYRQCNVCFYIGEDINFKEKTLISSEAPNWVCMNHQHYCPICDSANISGLYEDFDLQNPVTPIQVILSSVGEILPASFQEDDKIIWDSGSGYEIGCFISDGDEHLYNHFWVNLQTGKFTGKTLLPKNEITAYTEKLASELSKKYYNSENIKAF